MSKFINDLGREYFLDRVAGSWFVYEDMILSARGFSGRNSVNCMKLEQVPGEPPNVDVPLDFFVGYSILKYPELGYRRLGEMALAYVTRPPGAVSLGIRSGGLETELSPMTRLLAEHQRELYRETDIYKAAFKPVWNSPADFDALFAGEISGMVLNPQVIIEPTARSQNDEYDVFFNTSVIGCIDAKRKVRASNPQNKEYIRSLLA